jgi:hypothetical protein
MAGPVHADGRLHEAAVVLLHAVCAVPMELLRAARIRPAKANWLRAPWYGHHRGGAITVGRTIWFTAIWYAPQGLGNGSTDSTYRWLLHLAHEAGHLPQAERYGRSLTGKARYVAAFTWQYVGRALLMRRDVHDGTPLEREADLGRHVLRQLLAPQAADHPVVAAVAADDSAAVRAWCLQHQAEIQAAQAAYRIRFRVGSR